MGRILKDSATGCWNWPGALNQSGYGQIGRNLGGAPKVALCHRLSWEMHKGPIPPDLWVLHKCDNRRCCNPDHLFLGTNADNIRDRDQKGRHARLRGEDHPGAKLKAVEARAIRVLFDRGMNRNRIAAIFGITLATVRAIGCRRIWAD